MLLQKSHQHEPSSGHNLGIMLYMNRRKVRVFVCLQPYTTGTAASHFDFVFLSTFLIWCFIGWLKINFRSQAHSKQITLVCLSVMGNANAKKAACLCSFKCLDAEWKLCVLSCSGAQIKAETLHVCHMHLCWRRRWLYECICMILCRWFVGII